MSTSYDEVAYPSKLFDMTHPDRLRMFGKLHGLSPAPAETARLLEIGCGEGYNLLGLAAAYPDAHLEGFDLAATAVEIGRAHAQAAGLHNVVLSVGDIVDVARTIEPESFDYIVAHGVYAWVPEPVRDAVLALIARALAPHGVAYVSYNALPGGHFRMAIRDLLLHEVAHIADPAEKIAAARRVLGDLTQMDSRGEITIETLKVMAELLLDKNETVLFHDELGSVYAPHSLTSLVANAGRAGLRYLTDAEYVRVHEAFLADGDDPAFDAAEIDAMLVRRAQSRDNRNTCFFRSSLLVRGDAPVRRVLDLRVLDELYISTTLKYDPEDDAFHGDKERRIKFAEEPIKAAFQKVVAAHPGRLPLGDFLEDERWRDVVMRLFAMAYIDLHASPAPFAAVIGDRPETSAFTRYEISRGATRLPRLDHSQLDIEQEKLRSLLLAADGRRTIEEIAREVDGVFPADEIVPALNAAAGIALMRR